jgi:predicted amidohydrolase YtcJ
VLSASGLARLPAGLTHVDGLVSGREEVVGAGVGPLDGGEIASGLARTSSELAALGDHDRRGRDDRVASRPWCRFAARWRAVRSRSGSSRCGPGTRPDGVASAASTRAGEDPRRGNAGGLDPSPAELARRIRTAAARGAQVAVHCVGAATLVAALDAFAALPPRHRRGRRHRLEHLAECPPPLVARIAALGLTVVTNPAFVYWRGDVYRRETDGAARAWLYRARSLVAAGVPVAAASDAPVVAARSVARHGGRAHASYARRPDARAGERVDAATALAFATTNARGVAARRSLGRLVRPAPGRPDRRDAGSRRRERRGGARTAVRLTMIDGRIAWRA